jgi:hypothetical protein
MGPGYFGNGMRMMWGNTVRSWDSVNAMRSRDSGNSVGGWNRRGSVEDGWHRGDSMGYGMRRWNFVDNRHGRNGMNGRGRGGDSWHGRQRSWQSRVSGTVVVYYRSRGPQALPCANRGPEDARRPLRGDGRRDRKYRRRRGRDRPSERKSLLESV